MKTSYFFEEFDFILNKFCENTFLWFFPPYNFHKATSGMTKMASESPATKIEEPKTDMLFTGKACLAIKGFVSTL